MEGLKELAAVLQTVSGNAREVLLWWIVYKMGCLLCGYLFGGMAICLAYRLIKMVVLSLSTTAKIVSDVLNRPYVSVVHTSAIYELAATHADELKALVSKHIES